MEQTVTPASTDDCSTAKVAPRWVSPVVCLAIALVAAAITFLDYTPRFSLWRGLGNSVVHRSPEYSRGNVVLIQVNDPWTRSFDPLHRVMAWRVLFPFVWHYGHLPPRWILALPHVGCVVVLWLVAWLTYRRLNRWLPTFLATLLFAALPWFFVSSGWLGYFDSWYVLGLLATAFVPSRMALAAACLLTPWVDERFVLALPVTLLVRGVTLGIIEQKRWRELRMDLILAVVASLPYLAIRASSWLRGDPDANAYVQAHIMTIRDVEWTRFVAGLWSGYRAGWIMIGIAIWQTARRAGWAWGAALAVIAGAIVVGGLLIATDMSRSTTMICPLVLLGVWLWEGTRPASRAWLLPAVVLANFLLPATHELWFKQFRLEHFPTELANWQAAPTPVFVAADLIADAEKLLAAGNSNAAREKLNAAIEMDDSYAVAFAQRGLMRKDEGDRVGALADANEAVRLDPTAPFGYLLRGYVRAELGDRAGAIQDMQNALGRSAPDWPMRNNAAQLLERLSGGMAPQSSLPPAQGPAP